MSTKNPEPRSASTDALRARFDAARQHAIGIEDEVMLLDPDSLELAARAHEVLASLGDDPRFKLELPASQLEIVTPPSPSISHLAKTLLDARRALVSASGEALMVASAGFHPFSRGAGKLNSGARYDAIFRQYGCVARRQLVCALQVHVSAGNSDRALAVYNAARSYLPYLAALAANAPFYEAIDTGLASVRPLIGKLLPRQGVPPSFDSWQTYADTLAWGRAAGVFPDPAMWWWELRLHPQFGTLEFRVPDAQSTVADTAAIAAVIQGLVAWLGERHEAGEQLPIDPSWRIEENRWSAARDGIEGEMIDLRTGRRRDTRACLRELLDALQPIARAADAEAELDHALRLTEVNGAIAQRRAARDGGARAVVRWLASRFLEAQAG